MTDSAAMESWSRRVKPGSTGSQLVGWRSMWWLPWPAMQGRQWPGACRALTSVAMRQRGNGRCGLANLSFSGLDVDCHFRPFPLKWCKPTLRTADATCGMTGLPASMSYGVCTHRGNLCMQTGCKERQRQARQRQPVKGISGPPGLAGHVQSLVWQQIWQHALPRHISRRA